jgi:hypothetical protein
MPWHGPRVQMQETASRYRRMLWICWISSQRDSQQVIILCL